MRVLFYGGCHASAIRRVFDDYVEGSIETDIITNFKLIEMGTPFPYDQVGSYDAVVFSPIYRDGPYNTSHLLEACRARGVKTVSYPWIEWRGYWPAATNMKTGWGRLWTSKILLDMAESARTIEELEDRSFDPSEVAEVTNRNIESTTMMLRNREAESSVDIRLADFIFDNFRSRRLMLTSDHATNDLYTYLIPQIAENLGLTINRNFHYLISEVQHGISVPILPAVSIHLGLNFRAGDFTHLHYIGDEPMLFRDYLKLYFYRSTAIRYCAKQDTRILGEGGEATAVAKGKIVIAREIGKAKPHDVVEPIFLGGLKAKGQLRIFRSHWQITPFLAADT